MKALKSPLRSLILLGLGFLPLLSPAVGTPDWQKSVGTVVVTHRWLHSIKKFVLEETDMPFAATIVGPSMILTANHVLGDAETCHDRSFVFLDSNAKSPELRTYPCKRIIATDVLQDYTLAETEGDPSATFGKVKLDLNLKLPNIPVQAWTIVTNHNLPDRRVRSCQAHSIYEEPGFLFSPARVQIVVDCEKEGSVVGGDSGSPVFNAQNELAGILRAQLRGSTRYGFFIPVSAWVTDEIKKLLGGP